MTDSVTTPAPDDAKPPETDTALAKAQARTVADAVGDKYNPEKLRKMPVFYGTDADGKPRPAEITLAFDDGTADVQLVDPKTGEAIRDKFDQPQWTGRVPLTELTPR